jgi:hypothetical protein
MGFATLASFELMQRAAKLLSSSSLVPKDYQNNIPNCTIALNMAQRMGADPLMVMQHLYLVHGRPGWSAQFLIASFNQCGRFSAIRYRWSGTKNNDDWTCQAYAAERSSEEIIEGPEISIALAKKEGWYQKSGSKWQSIPQLMLMYRAAAWLVRTHAPEISMGLQTQEEIHDVYDARRAEDGRFEVTTESLRQVEATTVGNDAVSVGGGASDALPKDLAGKVPLDTAASLSLLENAADLANLSVAWDAIITDFTDTKRPLPREVEALYKDRKVGFEVGSK